MARIINIIDAGCGVGKTTSIINKIKSDTSDNKYLFITPFLSEVQRVKDSCKEHKFKEPKLLNNNKKGDLISLIKKGVNIASTHALFEKVDMSMLDELKKQNYILILDEVINTIKIYNMNEKDLDFILKHTVEIKKDGTLKWTSKEFSESMTEVRNLIKNNKISIIKNEKTDAKNLIWLFPYQIFYAFKEVYLLTYMFDGQIQKKYFDLYGFKYKRWYVKDCELTEEKIIYDYSEQKKLITIIDKPKLNDIGIKKGALSLSWFMKQKDFKQLSNNTYNFFRNIAKVRKDEALWTTFKKYQDKVAPHSYSQSFAPINARATNEFVDKTAVAYLGNRFLQPFIKNFLVQHSILIDQDFEDRYALSEMIQFIYRSAIRVGKPITIYVPSRRMRQLLEQWIKEPNS